MDNSVTIKQYILSIKELVPSVGVMLQGLREIWCDEWMSSFLARSLCACVQASKCVRVCTCMQERKMCKS